MDRCAPTVGIVSLGAYALIEPGSRLSVGGSELQLYLLARRLAAQGMATTLHVADEGQGAKTVEGLDVRPLLRVGKGMQLSALSAPGAIARLARARHGLFVTRSASALNGLVALAARAAGARYLHMCAHDFECNGRADATLSRPARWLHHLGMRRANVLTVQSRTQQDALRSVFRREGVIVPNLMPDGDPDTPLDARQGVLWVGRDVDWKQPEAFIELAGRLPDQCFTMVCQPQEGRAIERLAASAPANLRFVQGLPYAWAARLFPAHRVLVSTSIAEGFQNTVLQAVASGTPVATLATDPDGILSARGIGKTCGGDFDMLVSAVRQYLSDATSWQAAHAAAGAWCAERRAAEATLLSLVQAVVTEGDG